MTDNKGQISAEFLLLVGSLIVVMLIALSFIASQNELSLAMSAARNGVYEGSSYASSAIYPTDTFNDYSKSDYVMLVPSSVEIVNISYEDMGYDSNFEKNRIQFKVYAHSSKDLDKKELDSIGDRINYNLRKSIALTFETTKSTNKLYNPVFSPHYIFTTANVKWV
ncbi:MAG: class III signal peptide-containing protein [Methanobrevibacter millerae]|uniref:Class III signal peptide-containing protein n=1 Tax=Methanobrevibacter millerae TaxID=230361 RepID=A0A8T3VPK1_9EURY|nr:class III signal peptide-containing protein [Methanobrevibacter millerae]